MQQPVERRPAPEESVGIDLGLKCIAVTSDGERLEAARFFRGLEARIAQAQRRGHRRQAKRLYRKAARRRADALHKFSRRIVNQYETIIVGDVSSQKLVKTRMAKSVLDSGWSMLRRFLQYKGEHAGRAVEVVNERNTTRACSICGALLGILLACLTYSAATWGAPWLPPVRDGGWLQNGIKQQQRWVAHQNLSDRELNDATLVTSYICAVVDFEQELVRRATLLSEALQDGKKKKHLDARMLDGMTQAVPILVPLAKSGFATEAPSCDRALVIVQDYLAKYPEMLDKDADAVVEKALLASYDPSP